MSIRRRFRRSLPISRADKLAREVRSMKVRCVGQFGDVVQEPADHVCETRDGGFNLAVMLSPPELVVLASQSPHRQW